MKFGKMFATSVLVSAVSSAVFAAGTPSDNYIMFCGGKTQIEKFMNDQGHSGKLSKNDLKELNEQRSPVLDILENGDAGIQRLLDLGDKQDVGGFGVLMACGVITSVKTEIAESGCLNLVTNKAVLDNGGIEACERTMAAVQKRQK